MHNTWKFSKAAACAAKMLILIPWCRVLFEKINGLQLVKKFPRT